MDLWIRSQDRESIFKIKSVFYSTNNENEHLVRSIIVDDIKNGITKLGQYATKERALEVLDEIQSHLNTMLSINIAPPEYAKTIVDFVYEMPKE